ncbi:MAG: B12-binding domain-containing radical SAM protein [Deltaproteobacteria bacterium]|nr:B12-binding domain-containing radical SAM protein [Deltaproteobacteria bacterium]
MKKKKALLIYPYDKEKKKSADAIYPFPMLGLTMVAALFPPNWEVSIVNEAIEKVNFDQDLDLVGISALTCNVKRGYEIADKFRKEKIPVIMGGPHVAFMEEEVLSHADAVVVGEAELIFKELINDLDKGKLKKIYRSNGNIDLAHIPFPKRNLLHPKHLIFMNAIQTTRGCPNNCEFCAVSSMFGKKYRLRPLEEVDKELSTIIKKPSQRLMVIDDNILCKIDYARELFLLLKKYKVRWMGFSTIQIAKIPNLLHLAKESGCISLFIGFESLSKENLTGMKKGFVDPKELLDIIHRIQSEGIGIQGSFVFGFDHDDKEVFKRTIDFVQKANIELPSFSVLTPFPGTPLRIRLEQEGRIFDNNWSHYDMSHVVFFPKLMSPKELQDGYLWAQKYACAPRSILKRLLFGKRNHFFYFLLSNFALRSSQMNVVKRLKDREFPDSVMFEK